MPFRKDEMRTYIACLLFAGLVACAQDSSEITTKVRERHNTDGTLRWRIETKLRGKTPVLEVYQSNKGGVTGTTRSYMVGGEVVMMEADEEGDGFFETIIVYRKPDLEAFKRQRDGSVVPVSGPELATYKKQHAAITEQWGKAFDEGMDGEKFVEGVRETQQKIREAGEGRTDAKK